MSKLGGFRIGHKMVRIWRYNKFLRFKFRAARSGQSVATKLVSWGRKIRQRLRGGGGSYYRLGEKNDRLEPVTPKGQLAVYVGQMRYLVPVIYFNHPLFGELLKEAEAEFGFHHPGGITIPCPVSEFERVQTRIKNAEPARKNGFTRL